MSELQYLVDVTEGWPYSPSDFGFERTTKWFDISLTPADKARFGVTAMLCAAADRAVDIDREADVSHLLEDVVAGKPVAKREVYHTPACARFVGELIATDRGAAIEQAIVRLPDLARQKREATTVPGLLPVLQEEAEMLTAALAIETENCAQQEARVEYNRWFSPGMYLAYLLDTFLDIRKDYADDICGVAPTMQNYGELAVVLARHSKRMIPLTPMPLRDAPIITGLTLKAAGYSLKIPKGLLSGIMPSFDVRVL